jgi:putative membrane-bound dehydrogenase-like protein
MKSQHHLVAIVVTASLVIGQSPNHVPAEAFTVPEGLEVTVWATSPMLQNPTNMDIDHHGRVWVTEGVNYRGKKNRRKEGDRVVVLEDSDGDGLADKSTVFVQEPFLVSPLGIAVFDNVIVVAQPPDMLIYTDVDRNLKFDDHIDKREVHLTGFQGRNHDHSLHSVTAGPDGLWYWNSGNCGAVFTDKSDQTFRITSSYMDPTGVAGKASDDGHVYVGGFTARMQPDGTEVEIIGHNYRNSYEQAITSIGDVFQSDNDDPPACRVANIIEYGNAGFSSRDGRRAWRADQRRGQDTATAEWRQDDPGTMPSGDVYGGGSPTGVAFYENGALGIKWRGLLLTCEPGRNTIFGYLPKRVGAGFHLERFDWMTTNTEHKFVGSDFTGGRWDGQLHTQFRPADVAVGTDGAIYVADWFDGRVGGHQTLDNSLAGTIYRVAPKGFKDAPPKLELDSFDGQLQALQSPAVNVRHLGHNRLKIADLTPQQEQRLITHDNPYVRSRGVWVVALRPGPANPTILKELTTGDETQQLVAWRAARRRGDNIAALASECLNRNPSPALCAAIATAMRNEPPSETVINNLVLIGQRFDGSDRSYLDAFGIGCTGKEEQVYSALIKEHPDAIKWPPAIAWIAWRLGSASSVPSLAQRVLAADLPKTERVRALTAIAFIKDKAAMNAMVNIADNFDCSLSNDALLWCIRRMGNEWRDFGIAAELKKRGIYDEDAIVVQPVSTPPEPPTKQQIKIAAVLALKGIAPRGAPLAGTCYTCHKIGQQGIEFGPDIASFAKTQSAEATAEAILHPSKSLSHGFEGHTVETEDGNVDGIVLSRGNPVIIQSQGGLLQMIPKSKVKKIRSMRHSLMWPSQLYGLNPQGVADLIAFLRSQ